MKSTLLFFLSFFLIKIAYCQVVTFYEHENYNGGRSTYAPGTYISCLGQRGTWSTIGVYNDEITSISIPNGLKVTVWQDRDRGGASRVLTSDCPNLGPDWNDKITSFTVEWNVASNPGGGVNKGTYTVNFHSNYSGILYLRYYQFIPVSGLSFDFCAVSNPFRSSIAFNQTISFQVPANNAFQYSFYTQNQCDLRFVKANGSIPAGSANNLLIQIAP